MNSGLYFPKVLHSSTMYRKMYDYNNKLARIPTCGDPSQFPAIRFASFRRKTDLCQPVEKSTHIVNDQYFPLLQKTKTSLPTEPGVRTEEPSVAPEAKKGYPRSTRLYLPIGEGYIYDSMFL